MTLRELMAAHIEDPVCAGCHVAMDAIGLGLENYDGIGRWRTSDNGLVIDAAGELPGGRAFDHPRALMTILSEDPALSRCMVEKVLTYALGRGLEGSDAPYVDAIHEAFIARDHRFDELAILVAQSDVFRMRRGNTMLPRSHDDDSGATSDD